MMNFQRFYVANYYTRVPTTQGKLKIQEPIIQFEKNKTPQEFH